MSNNIIIINGPNLNLLGEREQSQYGSITFDELKKISDLALEHNLMIITDEIYADLSFQKFKSIMYKYH